MEPSSTERGNPQRRRAAQEVDEDPGAACVYDFAVVPPAMIIAIGIWQGAKICELEGVSFDTFAELTEGLVPVIAEDSLRKAADPAFTTDPEKAESTVKGGAEESVTLAEYFEELGIDASIIWAVRGLLQAGVEDGWGEHDIACVAELHTDDSRSPA